MKKILILILLATSIANAEEVDDFHDPKKTPPEASGYVNSLVNTKLKYIAGRVSDCTNRKTVRKLLESALNNNFSEIGEELKFSHSTPFQFGITSADQSPYVNAKSDYGAISCCVSRLNIKGKYVGIDKIDHFFGNGGLLWDKVQNQKSILSKKQKTDLALNLNVHQEHIGWGLSGEGVKSYGDLAANWQGYLFWSELIDGPKPYLKCDPNTKKFTVNRMFNIENYADYDWNESYNCSSFYSQKMASTIDNYLVKNSLKCPASKVVCAKLAKKYSPSLAKALLSPRCLDPSIPRSLVEEAHETEWEEIGDMAGGLNTDTIISFLKKRTRNNSVGQKSEGSK